MLYKLPNSEYILLFFPVLLVVKLIHLYKKNIFKNIFGWGLELWNINRFIDGKSWNGWQNNDSIIL